MRELDMGVVIGVEWRVGDLESFPPFAAEHLVVLVLAGLQVEEVGVDGGEDGAAAVQRGAPFR